MYRSGPSSLPREGPNFLPTSALNASGSGAARNRIAVLMLEALGLFVLPPNSAEDDSDEDGMGRAEEGDA